MAKKYEFTQEEAEKILQDENYAIVCPAEKYNLCASCSKPIYKGDKVITFQSGIAFQFNDMGEQMLAIDLNKPDSLAGSFHHYCWTQLQKAH